jgi:predicted DsbA family dithiol-disulfide isomerase
MNVEIWSDIMCPFCYIGKRKFEAALNQFPHKDQINVVWRSFQLNPNTQSEPTKSTIQHLSEAKGWSLDEARRITGQVTAMAREVGLVFDFDKAVIANSFDAHRLIHLARQRGLGDAAKEALLRAYFTEGRDTADPATLLDIGTAIGLDPADVEQLLASNQLANAVRHDIDEARQVGVRGVPFFVINRKYAVSGAQQPETFLGALQTAWPEWEKANPETTLLTTDGPVCAPGELC